MEGRTRRLGGVALAIAGLSVAVASGPAFAADGVIDVSATGKVRSFGGFDPQGGDPSPAAAAAVFGPGTVRSERDTVCTVSWPAASLLIDFADFGAPGVSACDPSAGKAQRLTAFGPGWATNRGLAIGDRARKMRKLYREDKLHNGEFELIDKRSNITKSGRQTVLSAFVSTGAVTALQVWAGAAGD